MRRLARKTLYSQDNSLEVRIEQLERRYSSPELEYVVAPFSGGVQTFNSGTQTQLTMTDDEFPLGQYGAANNPTPGENVYGYSVIDDFIQCNSFGKDGFWHLYASLNIETNGPATLDDAEQYQLFIGMELWDEDNVFVSTFAHFYSFRGIDNRTDVTANELVLRTEAMFFNGSVLAARRARFYAQFNNDSASNVQAEPVVLTLIRYGNAIGSINRGQG